MNVRSGKISTKGQITIPKDFRDKLNVKPGDEVIIINTKDGILIKPKRNSLMALRGLLMDEIDVEKADEFVRQEREKWRVVNEKIHD
ncbi:MAG: AbrB/MazE/SpoVT family DNA-binding domain-containing protein [Promethearchaeota archaeon]